MTPVDCDGCGQPMRTIQEGANAGVRYCPRCRYAEGEIVPDEHTPWCLR